MRPGPNQHDLWVGKFVKLFDAEIMDGSPERPFPPELPAEEHRQ